MGLPWGYYLFVISGILLSRLLVKFLLFLTEFIGTIILGKGPEIRIIIGTNQPEKIKNPLKAGRFSIYFRPWFFLGAPSFVNADYPGSIGWKGRTGIILTKWILLLSLMVVPVFIGFDNDNPTYFKLPAILISVNAVLELLTSALRGIDPVCFPGKGVYVRDGQMLMNAFRFREQLNKYLAGVYHYENDEWEPAAKYFEEVAASRRSREVLEYLIYCMMELREWEKGVAWHKVLEGQFEPDAVDYTNLGHLFLKLGDNKNAERALDKALEKAPGHPMALNNRGYLRITQKRYAEAKADLERALEVDPALAHALSNLGLIYLLEGKETQKAEKLFRKAIRKDEKYAYPYRNLALLYLSRNMNEDAKEYLIMAEKTDPFCAGLEAIQEFCQKNETLNSEKLFQFSTKTS